MLSLSWPVVAVAENLVLDIYVHPDCPHCRDARVFIVDDLAPRYPALRIRYHDVAADPSARQRLMEISRAAGVWPPGVPTFVLDGRVLVGFERRATSGALLERLAATAGTGREQRPVATAGAEAMELPWGGTVGVSELGLPLFTLALGLLDGFNPCAMWMLLFLLSLLIHLHDRRRMGLIAGTFVLVSGLVYYAFMSAWLNLFLWAGLTRLVRGILAGAALLIGGLNLKDAFGGALGPSLKIPESARPRLYARVRRVINAPRLGVALLSVALLAVLVNFLELLCTAGLPALYTAVLSQQGLGPLMYHGYLALYIAGYIADDALMVAVAVATLGRRRLSAPAGRRLKLISGTAMLGLGAVLLLRPHWLVAAG